MEHSPDGKAYLIAHGADINDPYPKGAWNNSWITGDQIYLIRVSPSEMNINDASKYEFYAGKGYFVNIPTKFISRDGKTMWLLYSGNYWDTVNGENNGVNPPGGHYGMTFQKIQLLGTAK
jgi:hypothetical protein